MNVTVETHQTKHAWHGLATYRAAVSLEGSCSSCPAGQYQDSLGSSGCHMCTAGKYRNANAASVAEEDACSWCTQAGNGTFQPQEGQLQCKAKKTCPPGYGEHTNGGPLTDRTCTTCVPNLSFSAQDDGAPCAAVTTCTPNEWESASPTASSDRDCMTHTISCPEGQYTFAPPGPFADRVCHDILTCVAGRYQTVAPTESSNRECTACEAGRYQDRKNELGCIACSAGKHRTDEVASAPEVLACDECQPGY